MNNELTTYEFDGQVVNFNHSQKNIMVNATEMAKIFGRRIDFFLKTEPTKAFLKACEFPPIGGNSIPIPKENLIQTKGVNGTYFHRILALKFAAWLDPNFEVWVYHTIDKILFDNNRESTEKLKRTAELKVLLAKKQNEMEMELKNMAVYNDIVAIKEQLRNVQKEIKTHQQAQLQLFILEEESKSE